MARALANTCSQAGNRVAFFMRKGADCLSKWVGEAERQLRLLFEEVRVYTHTQKRSQCLNRCVYVYYICMYICTRTHSPLPICCTRTRTPKRSQYSIERGDMITDSPPPVHIRTHVPIATCFGAFLSSHFVP